MDLEKQKHAPICDALERFKKIIWPTKENLTKETVQVVVVSVILGILIAIIDVGVKFGFDKLLQLG